MEATVHAESGMPLRHHGGLPTLVQASAMMAMRQFRSTMLMENLHKTNRYL